MKIPYPAAAVGGSASKAAINDNPRAKAAVVARGIHLALNALAGLVLVRNRLETDLGRESKTEAVGIFEGDLKVIHCLVLRFR
jgi:hypothetical protein